MKTMKLTRRGVLRGVLGGAALSVGLPILNSFLNNNGTAFASGAPLPTRFGTWFWGLGMDADIFVPKTVGAGYDLPEELQALEPVKQHVNFYSNFRVPTDGKPNLCHFTGWVALRSGSVPAGRTDLSAPSIDVMIADVIGGGTRFRSLEMAATAAPRDSYSFRDGDSVNPPAVSAVELYQRVFGPEFQDPNSGTFTPDPKIMVRKSVLSMVRDERQRVVAAVGAEDRARLDQYFTSIRELENRLELQLQKPAPAEACRMPPAVPKEISVGIDFELVAERHKAMTDILVFALACNQTNVFNMVYSQSGALTTRKGLTDNHHIVTHEEPVDPKFGYQVNNSWFVRRSMESWAYFVQALASFKEGDSTLLDRSLIYAHSDQAYAKVHSIDGIPMFTAGTANGRVKTGLHIDGKGAPATSLGYSLQRVMGLNAASWGTGSLSTSREVSEILV